MSNPIFSTCRPFLPLVVLLLLISGPVATAQNNNANTNTNTSNANTAANTNTGVNANTNANQNTNTNTNTSDQSGAKPTPSPIDVVRLKLLETTWYPLVVSLLFIALVIGFAATIARVILRSKSSFRSPLGLPEGSLRAMLAFLLVAFLGFYVYASVLSLSEFKLPDALLGIIATVIGFYFGSRAVEGAGAAAKDRQTGSVDGSVLDNSGTPAAGATVELSQPGGKKLTQPTDLSGKFKFDNVPIGDYQIQASKSGHTPSDPAKVKVSAGGTQTVSLKLK